MAFLEFKNVRISGISAGVPKHVEYNQDYPYFEEGEAEKYIASTSVRERRIADPGSVPLIFASQRLNALLRI